MQTTRAKFDVLWPYMLCVMLAGDAVALMTPTSLRRESFVPDKGPDTMGGGNVTKAPSVR